MENLRKPPIIIGISFVLLAVIVLIYCAWVFHWLWWVLILLLLFGLILVILLILGGL